MNIATQSYNEICIEIKTLEERIADLRDERKLILKRMYDNSPKGVGVVDYSAERVTGGQVAMPLDQVVYRLNEIDKKIDQFVSFLEIKRDVRDRIDKIIQSSEDLDMRVVYMRDYKRLPLKLIANNLGYSYEHVRRISSRNSKKSIHIEKVRG